MKTSVLHIDDDAPRTYTDRDLDRASGFYDAESFQQALYLERKRRERSRRPMLLLLIDVMRIPEEEQHGAVRTIAGSLAAMTREIDVKGWYSEGQVIGVIFTEFNSFDKEKMTSKIRNGIEGNLPHGHLTKLELSLHEFPQQDGDRDGLPPAPALYPEVTKKYGSKRGPFVAKRIIDIAGSIVGLVLFSPFFLAAAALIRLTSPGPVLFRQERVGLCGKKFLFLKFRTMYVGNDPRVHQEYVEKLIAGKVGGGNGNGDGNGGGTQPVFKITNDKRVTRIGRLLRKTSLDELPQFINVLLGDMSLVGPRPPIPYEVKNYDIWHRCRVMEVKPGITGLWQVMGRSTTSFDEMVRLDIKYSREWSFLLDLKILVMTPWAVLKGKGAY
jgi:lipopolysaccharide/colanic/teichoic acid biosynthesis glycosyltransferase